MKKGHLIVSTAAFLILILFSLILLDLFTSNIKQEEPETSPGNADLSDFDFNKALAYIPNTRLLYYKEELYTPDDFKSGNADTEPVDLSSVDKGYSRGQYGTYHLIIKLPKSNETYGLSSYSAMYSQRLFINGKEYPAVGVPGKTADATVPKTTHYTVYFTPDTTEVEIIIQFANFNHYGNGGAFPLYFGTQDKITERDAVSQQRINFLVGCAFAAFLFSIGMFFVFCRRYGFLWFSLACLSNGLRMLIVNEKTIMILFPNLPWRISLGLEYLVLIVLMLSILLYINRMFDSALHKTVIRAFEAVCVLSAAVVLLTPPLINTRFILWFEFCSAVTGIYVAAAIIYNIAFKKNNRHAEHVLILIGLLIFLLLSISDIWVYAYIGYRLMLSPSEIGMIVMVIINMLALVLRFSRTETDLEKAHQNEKAMQEANQLLDMMSRLKSDFMANISHEMRTPLTVMSSCAGLTSIEIRRGAVNENTLNNMDIVKQEAIRLGALVEQLMEVPPEKKRRFIFIDVSAISLLNKTRNFCVPVCQNNKNKILISVNPTDITLRVNPESIFQTLVNLVINANRHTKGGTILLSVQAESQYEFAEISVSDDGDGIAPDLMPSVFQRGVSGDESSGLGLAICKEIVEEHGGKIWIESTTEKGTIVRFTLPCGEGEEKDEKGNNTYS